MREIALEVKNVCVSYKLMERKSIKSLLMGKKNQRDEYFHAVKGVSFSLEKGGILGIVGKNGSGKSTLLKTIAGIFSPDSGSIDLHGNSVSLLSLGVGFQTNLSGRDNILLSGMMLGFPKSHVEAKTQEIIDFSELGDFIDAPVRTYSSGMYAKLAFSITAILETDMILIDEVLSVGDARFKKKSYEKMRQLISNTNRTVIIVSHSEGTLQELCDSILWIHDGQVRMYGDTQTVLEAYSAYSAQ